MSGESDVERALCIVTDWWQELRMLKQSGAKLEPGLSRKELAVATDIVGATFRSYFAMSSGGRHFAKQSLRSHARSPFGASSLRRTTHPAPNCA